MHGVLSLALRLITIPLDVIHGHRFGGGGRTMGGGAGITTDAHSYEGSSSRLPSHPFFRWSQSNERKCPTLLKNLEVTIAALDTACGSRTEYLEVPPPCTSCKNRGTLKPSSYRMIVWGFTCIQDSSTTDGQDHVGLRLFCGRVCRALEWGMSNGMKQLPGLGQFMLGTTTRLQA